MITPISACAVLNTSAISGFSKTLCFSSSSSSSIICVFFVLFFGIGDASSALWVSQSVQVGFVFFGAHGVLRNEGKVDGV